MKKILQMTVYSLVVAALLLPGSTGFAADVCGQGIGIPPFLSSGAKPNLLMVLDNSGSMLDAAYSKSGTLGQATSGGVELTYQRCLDGDYDISEYDNQGNETVLATVVGYDENIGYGGYFEENQWYQWGWETGAYAYSPWKAGQEYEVGDRVFDYGNIYEAASGGVATGESIDKDTNITWNHLFYLPRWVNGTTYPAGSFVWYSNQLYYTANGGTSNDPDDTDGITLSDDTGITDWSPVKSTWMAKSYAQGDIVTYEGIYYQALSSIASTDAKPGEDNGAKWQSLRQGAFVEIATSDACSGATGTAHKRTDALCLTIDETVTPNKVTAFAARGNFLNWAMSSKFDVEKKILTGGKFNYYEQVMVAEHRGCSGSRFLKQVKLDSGKFLSLGVRGSKYSADDVFMRDRVDTTDDTTRLEILAITADGFKPSAECQEMIDTITTKELNGANWSNAITACLGTFPDPNEDISHQRPMLNHSLQFCASLGGNTRDVGVIQRNCEDLYTGTNQSPAYDPSELVPEYGAYICYGLYESDVANVERAGYVGRCWKPSSGITKTCVQEPATVENECSAYPCTYEKTEGNKTSLYLNEIPEGGTVAYVYKCTKKAANANKDDGFGCTKADGDTAGSRDNWAPQYMWKKLTGTYEGSCDGPDDVAFGATAAGWENADDSSAVEDCIVQASIDYCNDTSIPEVIDPSDQAGDTNTTWNIPGVLTDSQILAQLGGTHPLATLKGYIAEQDRPDGIIHSVASDLRLGLMSFHDVGAATECDPTFLTDGIERFCPKENRDGATLLSKIDDGDLLKELDSTYDNGKRRHVDELAQEINNIRATSWTPLGEALYGALGYYTQNSKFCLNVDSSGNCLDWCLDVDDDSTHDYYDNDPDKCAYPADNDPVQYWCQDNHILVITEGESTADVSTSVENFVADPSNHFVTKTDEDDVVGDVDGDSDLTEDFNNDGTGESCKDSLYTSTYLDDVTWWGHRALPLYKERYVYDADGNPSEKNPISTYMVTTGTLTGGTGTGECDPDTLMKNAAVNGGTEKYYPGDDPKELEGNLYAVLGDIMTRASSGAAASVISNSRSGDGAIYQAVFWPKKENGILDEKGNEGNIRWIGNVHALFIDTDNVLYEDTNQNGKLEEGVDKSISIYLSRTVKRARGCYVDKVDMIDYRNDGYDEQCETDPVEDCDGNECVELKDIKYLWSANEQLRQMDVLSNRRIFTWNDFNNNGIVDDVESSSFNTTGETFLLKPGIDWSNLVSDTDMEEANRGSVVNDFVIPEDYKTFIGFDSSKTEEERANDTMDALVTWLLGKDELDDESVDSGLDDNTWIDRALRSRHYNYEIENDDGTITEVQQEWRLGDVIYSSPITVNKPAENFHIIYRDPTYKDFVERWSNRRTTVYFGANDGMLHAVNSGFYDDEDKQFYCSDGKQPDKSICENDYNLGEELWAYVPYNLQPHLKCLAGKFYEHKYFVDLEPRIADVRIFPEDADHPGGWGTILVGGMRFGGAPIAAEDLNGLDGSNNGIHDLREFSSSYFILDITNPESPKVLGELTRTSDDSYVDLNYTTSSPGIIVMRQDDGSSRWYLVLGNGPAEQDGTNTPGTQGKIALLPLDRLTNKEAIRIPDELPSVTSDAGVFSVPFPDGDNTSASYISDIISMDYNIEMTATDDLGVRYRTDAVYFGTTDGTDFEKYSDEAVQSIYPNANIANLSDQFYWDGGGRVYRLVIRQVDQNDEEIFSRPYEWGTPDGLTDDMNSKGPIRMLMDVKGPVSGSLSSGYDAAGKNFWIYTGTGRFDSAKDKTDDGRCLNDDCTSRTQSAFFALKEPIKDGNDFFGSSNVCNDTVMTWETIDWDITDWGTANDGKTEKNTETGLEKSLAPGGPGNPPGKRGLMRVDNILIEANEANATCYDKCLYCGHIVSVDNSDKYDIRWFEAQPDGINMEICFPGGVNGPIYDKSLGKDGNYTEERLALYITGSGCQTADNGKAYSTGLDGWYYVFHDTRERFDSGPLLYGELLNFTTYQSYNDKCKSEGSSYNYRLRYASGVAHVTNTVFDSNTTEKYQDDNVSVYDDNGNPVGIINGEIVSGDSTNSPTEKTIIRDPKGQRRGQSNAGASGISGSAGDFESENPDPDDRESNKLNWSDRCGQ